MMPLGNQFTNSHRIYWKFIPLLTVFLATCTFNQQPMAKRVNLISNYWIDHQDQLTKLTKFQVSGTFVYIDTNNKVYANFFWRQYSLTNYYLLLSNPFGLTELELNVAPKISELINRNGKKHINIHPTEIIYRLTGMEIPIKKLPYWLIGLITNATSFSLNRNGLLKTIEYKQNGKIWHIKYLTYHQNIQPKLPSYIELTKDKLRLKLKIDNWTINK